MKLGVFVPQTQNNPASPRSSYPPASPRTCQSCLSPAHTGAGTANGAHNLGSRCSFFLSAKVLLAVPSRSSLVLNLLLQNFRNLYPLLNFAVRKTNKQSTLFSPRTQNAAPEQLLGNKLTPPQLTAGPEMGSVHTDFCCLIKKPEIFKPSLRQHKR